MHLAARVDALNNPAEQGQHQLSRLLDTTARSVVVTLAGLLDRRRKGVLEVELTKGDSGSDLPHRRA